MMINIKSNQRCSIDTISSKQKENLYKFHEIHTYKSTQKQLEKQVKNSVKFIKCKTMMRQLSASASSIKM